MVNGNNTFNLLPTVRTRLLHDSNSRATSPIKLITLNRVLRKRQASTLLRGGPCDHRLNQATRTKGALEEITNLSYY